MSKMCLVVVLALAACLIPGAMSAEEDPCKNEATITSVMKSVESCVKDVTPYESDQKWWAKRVAEQMRWTPGCTLDMVPAILDGVIESYGYYGRDRKQAVACLKKSLPRPDSEANETTVAPAAAEPCKDESTVARVKKIVESCVKNVSPYPSDHTWWAKRVAEQMSWTPGCTLDMVPAMLDGVIESYGYYGRDRKQAVGCVKTSLFGA